MSRNMLLLLGNEFCSCWKLSPLWECFPSGSSSTVSSKTFCITSECVRVPIYISGMIFNHFIAILFEIGWNDTDPLNVCPSTDSSRHRIYSICPHVKCTFFYPKKCSTFQWILSLLIALYIQYLTELKVHEHRM